MKHHRIAGAILAAGLFWGTAPAAWAHDFFLLPERFDVPREGAVTVQASVGSSFPKPENVVPADRIERLTAYGNGNPQLSIGTPSANGLNLRLSNVSQGIVVAAATVRPRDVEYSEERIPLILEEYRFMPAAAEAVARLPAPRIWKVSSRRFAKSLICIVRCTPNAAATRPTGAEFEFVAVGGMRDQFQLLKGSRPLANYPVDIVGGSGERLHSTTDARGIVRLPADAKGPTMLFAAFLTPPTIGDRFTLDLTSLTFGSRY